MVNACNFGRVQPSKFLELGIIAPEPMYIGNVWVSYCGLYLGLQHLQIPFCIFPFLYI